MLLIAILLSVFWLKVVDEFTVRYVSRIRTPINESQHFEIAARSISASERMNGPWKMVEHRNSGRDHLAKNLD